MRRFIVSLFIIAIATIGIGTYKTQDVKAHVATSVSLDCDSATTTFDKFPEGTHIVTVTSAKGSTTKSFTGTSGSVSVLWPEVGAYPRMGGVHSVNFTWVSDGGGSSGTYNFDADAESCVPATTTTTTVAPTTTTTQPAPTTTVAVTTTVPTEPTVATGPPPTVSTTAAPVTTVAQGGPTTTVVPGSVTPTLPNTGYTAWEIIRVALIAIALGLLFIVPARRPLDRRVP
jgi:hypothetical protein